MASFRAPSTAGKSPNPSTYGDTPHSAYSGVVREATGSLMEKVQMDVSHVVNSLEAIWNEVGYSGEERRLQMDKLSDELTQTLKAKLAQEVEVRDVFKKDIADKVAECVMMARSVDDDRTGALPAELDVSSLRLSHGLMRLEEEQSKLEVVVKARRADFVAARDVMRDASARLGEKLPAEFDEVGHEDLTLARLGTFRQTLEQLQAVEAERAVELARLRASSLALVKELDDEALDCYDDDFGEDDDYVRSDGSVLPKALNSLGAAKVEKAKRRLTALKDEKQSRLARLSSLGEEISLLWERLDVGEAKQLSFRAAVKHSSISKATFKIGEKELAALRTELHTRLGDLVAARRARIKALWDEMTEPDAARRDFGAYFDASEPTEEMLAAHEAKLAQLEARREALQPLLKMIEKREELLLERTALNALQKDASRLLRRGPGAAQERKYEVDAMKRVKGLPKLTEKLFEKLVEWERTQSPVLRDGLRYLDKMRDDQKEAAAERAQALEAKKLAATIRKEKLRDRNLQ